MTETLCACGCGQPVKGGRRFVRGHHFRQTTSEIEARSSPEKVRVLQMHGYIDEAGVSRMWQKHMLVDDPEEIAILQARGVPLEPVTSGK